MSDNETTTLGKYLLIERLHLGEKAETHVARDADGKHAMLAVKRLLPQTADDKEYLANFLLVAHVASPIRHRSVCEIFDFGSTADAHYLAREYVSGKDLRDLQRRHVLQRRLIPEPVAMHIAKQLCEGLCAIHQAAQKGDASQPRIYGDANPSSVLVGFSGEVKLGGYGLDQRGDAKGPVPEVQQFGGTLYELLTGKPAFSDHAAKSTPPEPPSKIRSTVPAELDQLVMKCLSTDRAGSFDSIVAVQKALDGYLTGRPDALGSASDLASLMKRVFAGALRIEKERARRVATAKAPTPAPGASPAAQESTATPAAGKAPQPVAPATRPVAPAPRATATVGGSNSVLGYVSLAAGIVVLIVGIVFFSGSGSQADDDAPAPTEGQLRIVSPVPVDIYLDGAQTKLSAPLSQYLKVGRHAVTIVFPSSQRRLNREFELKPGEVVKINLVRAADG